jgi:hypothetical protein
MINAVLLCYWTNGKRFPSSMGSNIWCSIWRGWSFAKLHHGLVSGLGLKRSCNPILGVLHFLSQWNKFNVFENNKL